MKMVYVADARTPDTWTRHGYSGSLKIIDDRNQRLVEAPTAVPGKQYTSGWGVHNVGADHQASMIAAQSEIERLGLGSYGLDLEDGWYYDLDRFGYSILHTEWEKTRQHTFDLFEAIDRHIKVPVWVTCLANKYYPFMLWYELGASFVSPQLYGATDVLPDALGSWNLFETWLKEQGTAPTRLKFAPDWVHQWLAKEQAAARLAQENAIPSLWKGQTNVRADGSCIRFDAEIMSEADYA